MTANKTSGLGDRWFVGGYDLSGDVQQIARVGGGPATIDQTDITQLGHARVGTLLGGEMNWTSYFDKGANQAHAVLSLLPRTSAPVSYFHQPGVIGSAVASMMAEQIGYDPSRGADASLTLGVAAQNSDGFPLEWGESLTPGVRTDSAATNGASFDYGSTSTLFGWQAYLHVTAVTGTSVTVKLQDSADNSTFADLTGAAFTAATGRTYQRLAGAAGSTVRRYVRAVTTGTFTVGTFVVNFVRNEIAVTY